MKGPTTFSVLVTSYSMPAVLSGSQVMAAESGAVHSYGPVLLVPHVISLFKFTVTPTPQLVSFNNSNKLSLTKTIPTTRTKLSSS